MQNSSANIHMLGNSLFWPRDLPRFFNLHNCIRVICQVVQTCQGISGSLISWESWK